MPYPTGTYVVDTRTATLGQVMATEPHTVHIRPPRGGLEWEAPPHALRPATTEERAAAGLRTEARP